MPARKLRFAGARIPTLKDLLPGRPRLLLVTLHRREGTTSVVASSINGVRVGSGKGCLDGGLGPGLEFLVGLLLQLCRDRSALRLGNGDKLFTG
jgi:hypothetical protein